MNLYEDWDFFIICSKIVSGNKCELLTVKTVYTFKESTVF